MLFRISGAVAALLLAACAGVPDERSAPAPQVVAQSPGAQPGDENERVCSWEQVTGTHMTREVCRNRADVEREREATAREMQRMSQVPNTKQGK